MSYDDDVSKREIGSFFANKNKEKKLIGIVQIPEK
jgi:hypothetical protein